MPRNPNRVCSEPGCITISPGPRCPLHARGTSTTARGYDHRHRQARQAWASHVAEGVVNCARCYQPIHPGQPWHLDHDDEDRSQYLGPSHATCNTAAGGRATQGH